MAYVTPRTWTTGQTVTAAEMNQDVRDNVAEVYSRVNTKNMIITAVFEDELLAANKREVVARIRSEADVVICCVRLRLDAHQHCFHTGWNAKHGAQIHNCPV